MTQKQPAGRLQRGGQAPVEDRHQSREAAQCCDGGTSFPTGDRPTGTSSSHRAAEAGHGPWSSFAEKLDLRPPGRRVIGGSLSQESGGRGR